MLILKDTELLTDDQFKALSQYSYDYDYDLIVCSKDCVIEVDLQEEPIEVNNMTLDRLINIYKELVRDTLTDRELSEQSIMLKMVNSFSCKPPLSTKKGRTLYNKRINISKG